MSSPKVCELFDNDQIILKPNFIKVLSGYPRTGGECSSEITVCIKQSILHPRACVVEALDDFARREFFFPDKEQPVNEEPSEGFRYAYGWNVYYQMIMGVCAVSDEGKLTRHRAWLWSFTTTIFIWLPQAASLFIFWGELNAFITCLSINISIVVTICKIVAIQRQRKVVGWIVGRIADDWVKIPTEEKVRCIMAGIGKISRRLSIVSFFLTNFITCEFIASRVWGLWQGSDLLTDPRLASGFIYESYFPFDTSKIEIFAPLWIFQCIGTYTAVVGYAGVDCLVSTVVLHVCGQVRIIRESLEHIVDETTISDPERYWNRVAAIVTRHEQLNHLAFVIKTTFSAMLLVQMLACSITFCFQGYMVLTILMERDGAPLPVLDLGFFILYSVYTLIHLLLYCYIGDMLFTESTSLADDFYKAKWYEVSSREAKAYLLVCQRSRIPLELTGGKFCCFNLQLFNAVLKNSMGYLSMLIAIKDRLID